MSSSSSERTLRLSSRRSPYSRSSNVRNSESRPKASKSSSNTSSSTISRSSSGQSLSCLKTSLVAEKDHVFSSSSTESIGSGGVSRRFSKSPYFSSTSSRREGTENLTVKTWARNLLSVKRDLLSSSPSSAGESVRSRVSRISSESSNKSKYSSSSSSTYNRLTRDVLDSQMERLGSGESSPSQMELGSGESLSSQRITENIFEEDGSVYRPNRERKWLISGTKQYFRGDLNRVLKNSIIRTPETEETRPEKRFYENKEPKETEITLKQRQLDREEDEKIDNEMEVEAEEINHERFFKYKFRCECDFPHPDYWSEQMITEVHMNFHKIKHKNLKTTEEMVLYQNEGATIIKIQMNENNSWTEKAFQVIEFIDIELGYSGISTRYSKNLHDTQVYLILHDTLIIGCTVAHKAHQGFRLVSKLEDQPMVSPTPEPIKCGISRIWVIPKYRRHKLASFLLESVRRYFMPEPLEKESIAVSNPTTLGRLLLASYMTTNDFKVYFPE